MRKSTAVSQPVRPVNRSRDSRHEASSRLLGQAGTGLALCAFLALSASLAAGAKPAVSVEPARVAEIAQMLPPAPAGLGRPITDRACWDALARDKRLGGIVPQAQRYLKEPLAPWSQEHYLDYSRDGNRTRYQDIEFARRKRLSPLVLAECLENKGRFLPAIRELLGSLCDEKTWVLPAHDGGLGNFKGTSITIDLFSSMTAWNLAQTLYLLGDKLDAATHDRVAGLIQLRVLEPFRATLAGKTNAAYWLRVTNNWNAVCLANVTGAALSLAPSPQDRAMFVAAAEKYTKFFLSGFTADGYCSEGVGYWNFGFGHYVMLAETVRQATAGKLDLLARPEVRGAALFGHRVQIVPGVCPAFADCSVKAKPSPEILRHVSLRLGLGLTQYETDLPAYDESVLDPATLISLSLRNAAPAKAGENDLGLRSWFQDMHVLIARPAKGTPCRMGVAIKGGHNAEHHNHNDVGSYVVVVDDCPVLLDPGAEVYTARTFSSRRYESKLLNSWGHPVPLAAGQLQSPGRKCEGKLVRNDFTDDADTLAFDIGSAYPAAKELRSLRRTFVYSRGGAGSLSVKDEATFNSPQAFGTALITCGKWKQTAPGKLQIDDGGKAVTVEIDTGGKEFTLQADQIKEESAVHPTRIGINLTQPATEATITVKIVAGSR